MLLKCYYCVVIRIHSKPGVDCYRQIHRYCISLESGTDYAKDKGSITRSHMVDINSVLFPFFLLQCDQKIRAENFLYSFHELPCHEGLPHKLHVRVVSFFFLLSFAPLSGIVLLYSRIMRALRKGMKPGSDTKGGESQQKRNKQNEHVMKIFKSFVVALVVSFFLLIIFMTLLFVFPGFSRKDKCSLLVGFGYYVSPLLGTAINPLILFTFSTSFRGALQMLCLPFSGQCCFCCKVHNIKQYQVNDY